MPPAETLDRVQREIVRGGKLEGLSPAQAGVVALSRHLVGAVVWAVPITGQHTLLPSCRLLLDTCGCKASFTHAPAWLASRVRGVVHASPLLGLPATCQPSAQAHTACKARTHAVSWHPRRHLWLHPAEPCALCRPCAQTVQALLCISTVALQLAGPLQQLVLRLCGPCCSG